MRARLPWLLALAYAVLFTWLGAVKYAVHRNFVDFGIFTQTAASAFGCFCNTIEGSHWAFHFSPILYVAGAALRIAHSPLALVALQALACALTIPPIYAIAARGGDRFVAALAACVVALYPPLAGLTFNDFHENGFAPAAVAWMLWAFTTRRLWLALLFAAVTLSIKEDQAIFVAIAGAFAAVRCRGSAAGRAAIVGCIGGIAVAIVFFFWIQPHAAAGNPHWAPQRFYAWTSDDVRALLPRGLAEHAGFFVLAFLPLLFLPFRSPGMWLAVAPLAEVLLSRMSTTYTMGSHYAGAWLGYVLAAFAFAVRDLPVQRARMLLYWCIALCVLELVVANPLHPGLNLHRVQERDVTLDRFLQSLPRELEVQTQEEAYTHLALDNPNATLFPETAHRQVNACYYLFDLEYPDSPRLLEFTPRNDLRFVRRDGRIELDKRAGCH